MFDYEVVCILMVINLPFQTYVFFIARDRIEIISSLEGRFEESVIAYLFLLNILPILIIPMTWIETRKFTDVLNNWTEFEVCLLSMCVCALNCGFLFYKKGKFWCSFIQLLFFGFFSFRKKGK